MRDLRLTYYPGIKRHLIGGGGAVRRGVLGGVIVNITIRPDALQHIEVVNVVMVRVPIAFAPC